MKGSSEGIREPTVTLCYIRYLDRGTVDEIVPASWSMANRQRRVSYAIWNNEGRFGDDFGLAFASDIQNVEICTEKHRRLSRSTYF